VNNWRRPIGNPYVGAFEMTFSLINAWGTLPQTIHVLAASDTQTIQYYDWSSNLNTSDSGLHRRLGGIGRAVPIDWSRWRYALCRCKSSAFCRAKRRFKCSDRLVVDTSLSLCTCIVLPVQPAHLDFIVYFSLIFVQIK